MAVPSFLTAQTSELYLNDWLSANSYVVQNGQVVRQFVRRDTVDGPGMSVVGDSIKMIGVFQGSVGLEYDLNGNLLSGQHTNPAYNSLYDGAADGARTWSVGHNDFTTNFAVVQGDADWGTLQVLFVPQTRSLGITYDANTDTLWIGADAPGGITHVQQYDLAGNLLLDFPILHGGVSYAIAWDPADDTLWIPAFNDPAGQLFQYDKVGNLLQTVAVAGLANVGVLGAEFNMGCATSASATFRNGGSNPASYTATPPVLGGTFVGTVDLNTTGHNFAALVGYSTPLSITLGGGQVVLVNFADVNGELLAQPLLPGPIAVFNIGVPNDLSLCAFALSTQAVHVGGVQPFALSNAQDLVLGH